MSQIWETLKARLELWVAGFVGARQRPSPGTPAEAPIEAPAPPAPALPEVPAAPPRATPTALAPQALQARTTNGKLRRFALDRPTLTIGRAADNDIVIGDEFSAAPSVADHHARVNLQEPWVVIEAISPDLVVLINGVRAGRSILRNGWRVTLGELELAFSTAGLGTAPLADLDSAEIAQAGTRAPQLAVAAGVPLLPEGALLADRYIVLDARSETLSQNSYIVESLYPALRCPQCGYDANGPELSSCGNCGGSLYGSMSFYPHHHVKEGLDEEAFGVERQLIGLSHPNVLLPREAFDETPYGDTIRHYVVGPEAPSMLATNLRVPQEMPQVLEWAQQLAQGMAYLHNNGVALGTVDLWRIALDDRQAWWTEMAPCEFVAESERSARFSREVCGLMETMYYLVTGQRTYDDTLVLSPPGVGMLFDRVLGGLEAPTAAQLAKELQKAVVEVRRPSSVDVRVGRLSDVGQTRQLNEDSLLSIEIGRIRRSISEPLGLYVVCDGMGGHAAGDVASGLVVQTMARKALAEALSDGLAERTPPNWEVWLKNAMQEANQAVFGHRRASGTDMGTTCVAALLHGDTVTIGNAGDSRCYVVNSEGIRQLTTDHSLVQRLVQLKQLTPEEARTHPQRNVIYKNLGDKPSVEPDVNTHRLSAGDRLLLCSDGLSGMVEDGEIRQIVMSATSPQEVCRRLVNAANAAGGDDNISVIIVQLETLV